MVKNKFTEKLLEETIQTYENYADSYENKWGKYTGIQKIAEKFISYLQGKKVLDIGCGPGRDSKYLNDKGFNITGIDLTTNFLNIAQKKVPNAEFYKMDMRKLQFPNDNFDGIWCNAAFLHIPKYENNNTLQEFNRVLKKDAILYLSVKKGEGEKIVSKEYWKGRKLFIYYTENEISELLKQNKFEIIYTENIKQEEEWINLIARKK